MVQDPQQVASVATPWAGQWQGRRAGSQVSHSPRGAPAAHCGDCGEYGGKIGYFSPSQAKQLYSCELKRNRKKKKAQKQMENENPK